MVKTLDQVEDVCEGVNLDEAMVMSIRYGDQCLEGINPGSSDLAEYTCDAECKDCHCATY